MRSFKETVCTHTTVKAVQLICARLERHISIAWFCFGKSCLSYAIFSFWILSPINLFICKVTLMNSFQIPTRTQCKNSFGKQFQFMDFSISPILDGIRLVTPSEARYDNSDTCILVTETFLKRFTLPVDNPEGRGEGEEEFAPKYIHQTRGLIT